MTRYSYNHWPVVEVADADRLLETITVGGRKFRVRAGDVARVFEAFLTRFVAEVEPIDAGELDDWSYAVRLTRGSATALSCHSSGTAVDLNSLAHPRGVRGTFGTAKTAAMRRLLRDFPVLRWGEDFKTAPADSMHVEINATPEDVAVFTRTLEDHVDAAQEDRVAAKAAADVLAALGLDPASPRLSSTGWQPNGTYDRDKPYRMTVAEALAADRNGSLQAAQAVTALTARTVGLEQGQNTLLEAVAALAAKVDALTPPQPPAPPAGG